MRFSLMNLLIVAAIAPPILALGYWAAILTLQTPAAVLISAAWLAAVVFGPVACWREFVSEICGPFH